ncbi:MAG: zf-HC2 domain-containing protein [Polyangiaceae bacterium]
MSALKAPTDCVLYARALHAYVDGELSVDHTAELEAHVAKCGECFEQVEHHRAVRLSLRRTSSVHAAPSAFRDRMAALVTAEAAIDPMDAAAEDTAPRRGSQWTSHRAHGRRAAAGGGGAKLIPLRHVMALAVAAGVVFAVGLSRVRPQNETESGVTAAQATSTSLLSMSFDDVIDDLVAMHASPPPPETTNPEELPRFDTFVGVPVRRPADPAFKPLGVKWDGARMHVARGKRAAVMFYSMQNGHRATMYVFDAHTLQMQRTRLQQRVVHQRPVYVGKVRGYSFAATERAGVGYALATDLDTDLSANLVAGVQ